MISAKNDYPSSDFDVRHSFSVALTYQPPAAASSGPIAAITRDWSIDAVPVLGSSPRFNISRQVVSPGAAGIAFVRPDLMPGVPIWIANPAAAGGKSLNPAAFTFPSPFRQGTESRNDLRGFGLAEVDLSLMRKFPLPMRTSVKLQVDALTCSTIRLS